MTSAISLEIVHFIAFPLDKEGVPYLSEMREKDKTVPSKIHNILYLYKIQCSHMEFVVVEWVKWALSPPFLWEKVILGVYIISKATLWQRRFPCKNVISKWINPFLEKKNLVYTPSFDEICTTPCGRAFDQIVFI